MNSVRFSSHPFAFCKVLYAVYSTHLSKCRPETVALIPRFRAYTIENPGHEEDIWKAAINIHILPLVYTHSDNIRQRTITVQMQEYEFKRR